MYQKLLTSILTSHPHPQWFTRISCMQMWIGIAYKFQTQFINETDYLHDNEVRGQKTSIFFLPFLLFSVTGFFILLHSLFLLVQVNFFQMLFFCRTWGEHVVYINCSECQKQFFYTACSPHVLSLEFSFIELVIQ